MLGIPYDCFAGLSACLATGAAAAERECEVECDVHGVEGGSRRGRRRVRKGVGLHSSSLSISTNYDGCFIIYTEWFSVGHLFFNIYHSHVNIYHSYFNVYRSFFNVRSLHSTVYGVNPTCVWSKDFDLYCIIYNL